MALEGTHWLKVRGELTWLDPLLSGGGIRWTLGIREPFGQDWSFKLQSVDPLPSPGNYVQ